MVGTRRAADRAVAAVIRHCARWRTLVLDQIGRSESPLRRLADASYAVPFVPFVAAFIQASRSATVAYVPLLKLRSVALNVLSGITGALLATGGELPLWPVVAVTAAGGLAAAGCGAVNSYLDRDLDRVMRRTRHRPLPMNRIAPPERALWAGVFLIVVGLAISVAWLSPLTTLFIALGAAIYIPVYTMWLKRRTPWSVVVGGLAGSCVLAAGWVAVGGSLGWPVLFFGAFVFLWTPGHFWGLAIRTREDSRRAGVPTLPVVYGDGLAFKFIALSNLILPPLSLVPYAMGLLDEVYLAMSALGGIVVLAMSIWLWFWPTPQRAWTAFKISSPYLAVVYLAVIIDTLLV